MQNKALHLLRLIKLKTIVNQPVLKQYVCSSYLHTCVCDKDGLINKNVRETNYGVTRIFQCYSTHTNEKRQKVIVEPGIPKIIIDDKSDSCKKNSKSQSVLTSIDPYIKLMRLDKPIGIWLLYWPCSWSIALGAIETGAPLIDTANMLGLFLTGAVLMRGAGCTINDLWDRDIDAKVERTKSRPLVSGAISQKQAIVFLGAQLSAALTVLLQLNWYSVVLGASSMALVITYPLAKRFTNYPQLVLGATFNWGALLGYSAITGQIGQCCLPLYLGACAWTVMYDTIYAYQDRIDDARIGIKSCALTFGSYGRPALCLAGLVGGVGLTMAAGSVGLGPGFYAALGVACMHAGMQIYSLNPNNPEDCAKKFKSNTWIGFIIFLGIMAGGYEKYWENREKNDNSKLVYDTVPLATS